MEISRKQIQSQDNKKEIDQFTLSREEQANFIKMLAPYHGNISDWARDNGYMNLHSCYVFNFITEVVNIGQKDEHNVHHIDTFSINNWRSDMNKKGWSWVNDNVVLLITQKHIVSPMDLVNLIKSMYNFKFAYKPYLTKDKFNELSGMIKQLLNKVY